MDIKPYKNVPNFVAKWRGKWSDEKKIFAARSGAEVVSVVAASLGSVLVTDVLLRKPYHDLECFIARHMVEPHLDGFNNFLSGFPGIDTPRDRERRAGKPTFDQALLVTEKMLDVFGLKMILGIVGQYIAQKEGLKILGVGEIDAAEQRLTTAVDWTVGLGGIYVLSKHMPETSIRWQHGLQNILEKVGVPPKDAENWSSWAVNKQIPNMTAFAASLLMLQYFNRKDIHIG
jgi:hypothetical protein